MTIQEMEPKIDRLGLDKLEVLLRLREVDWFVCARNVVTTFGAPSMSQGDLVVFGGDGRAWTKRLAFWRTGQSWRIYTSGNSLYVGGWRMDRCKSMDLKGEFKIGGGKA